MLKPMRHRALPWMLGMLVSVWSIASHAQPPASSSQPTLADAPVPPLTFESALRTYRPLVAGRPVPWVQANERVTQIGGWRTYTREAHAPEPTAKPPATPATPATPAAPTATPPAPESPHAHH